MVPPATHATVAQMVEQVVLLQGSNRHLVLGQDTLPAFADV